MQILSNQLVARWSKPEVAHLALLREAGIEMLLLEDADAGFRDAARQAGIETELAANVAGLSTTGLWPGIRRGPSRRGRDIEVASASREPWVDANSYLVAYQRALEPGKPAVLAYEANEKAGVKPDVEIPFDTLELALIEARVAGGNYVLDLPARFREKLLAKDPKAVAAWQSLRKTAAWLKQNEGLFGRPALPEITALVEPGGTTRELSNLLLRRGASPMLVNAAVGVAPAGNILALVAAGLKQVPERAFAHAEAGAVVVIDSPAPESAKLLRKEVDRTFYTLGKGTVVAYQKRIVDPSEFALDVIDLITHKRRAARLWNASAAIPLATQGPGPKEALLHVINYGSPAQEEVQAHIQGRFSKAVLLCPEQEARALKTASRGTSTEVFLPTLRRLATVRFSN